MHITDPHLFADPQASLRGVVTDASLRAVLEHVRRAQWQADLVAMTGDLSQDETEGSYRRFASLFAELRLPVHCVPGNHDVRSIMEDVLGRPPFYYCSSATLGNWIIVGIDSCVAGDAGGRVDEAELARLQQLLRETPAEHALVCLHHPPLAMGSAWLDRIRLHNGNEFLDAVSRTGKTRAALFGHAHQEFHADFEGISIIGTPSTCRQFRPASEHFDLDDSPPGYRRIDLSPDGTVNTELIWLNDR